MSTPQPDEEKDLVRPMGRGMAWLAALALIGVLWLFFEGVQDRRANPNRHLTVAPGAASELVLKRNPDGHYFVPGAINGQPVTFMLDTGATQVALPARLGRRLGLQAIGPAIQISTANGIVEGRMTLIDELAFGPFALRQTQATLNPGMDGDEIILLGMNVLKRLELAQRGDTLVLRKSER
ncbi:MAG: retroviral-like aspartic protease family protein [Azoarcus sp.]|jgi:aspartyl protease family protein|nr:retroviral-like aspartic protease family protein [Azoarcus sp.]